MKYLQITLLLLLLILPNLKSFGQTIDSLKANQSSTEVKTEIHNNRNQYYEDDDFAPGLLFMALIGIAIILCCVGIGIGIVAFLMITLFALITFGILSTSIIVGINKKSFSKGFKIFIVALSTIGCAIVLCLAFFGVNEYLHWFTRIQSVFIGFTSGLIVGFLLGFSTYYIIRHLTNYLKHKLKIEPKLENADHIGSR